MSATSNQSFAQFDPYIQNAADINYGVGELQADAPGIAALLCALPTEQWREADHYLRSGYVASGASFAEYKRDADISFEAKMVLMKACSAMPDFTQDQRDLLIDHLSDSLSLRQSNKKLGNPDDLHPLTIPLTNKDWASFSQGISQNPDLAQELLWRLGDEKYLAIMKWDEQSCIRAANMLLDAGLDTDFLPKATGPTRSVLGQATSGNTFLLETFLNRGLVSLQMKYTVFQNSLRSGDLKNMQLLLDHGVDIQSQINLQTITGVRPPAERMQWLLEQGLDPHFIRRNTCLMDELEDYERSNPRTDKTAEVLDSITLFRQTYYNYRAQNLSDLTAPVEATRVRARI